MQKIIFALCTLVYIGTASVHAQTTNSCTAPVKTAEAAVLFEDTIKAASKIITPTEIKNDSMVLAVEQAIDSIDLLPTTSLHIPKVSMELLQDRLNCIESTIPLTCNNKVASFIDYFMIRNRNYTQTMLERRDFYFPIFEAKLAEYGMPDELKYLSVVESGLNYAACSRVGALGLWQFMPGTGRDFRLSQDFYVDERQDPILATEAACKYLKRLYRMFGDWELALASYNCGPGKVLGAIRKTGKRKFWDIYESLPMETRSYVPQFVALTYALNYPSEHNIFADADSLLLSIDADTVLVNQCLSLDKIAKQLGVDASVLKVLNPSLRHFVTPAGTPYALRLPEESIAYFLDNRSAIIDSSETSQAKILAAAHGRKDKQYRLMLAAANSKRLKPQLANAKVKSYTQESPVNAPKPDSTQISVQTAALANLTTTKRNSANKRNIESTVPSAPSLYAKLNAARTNKLEGKLDSKLDNVADGKKAALNTKTAFGIVMCAEDDATSKSNNNLLSNNTEDNQEISPKPKKKHYTVKRGEGIIQIAGDLDVTIHDLKSWNHLKSNHLSKGQKLTYFTTPVNVQTLASSARERNQKAEKANQKVNARFKTYKVQPGDTLWAICQKHEGMSVADLVRLNNLKDRKIVPGQKLIIG